MTTLRLIYLITLVMTVGVSYAEKPKPYVIVIDAGHGGTDPGALGCFTTEKDINLAIAKKLGNLLTATFPDVKVIYTRSTDVFVKIRDRMQKAKDVNADLFISIHCNSAAKENPNRTSLSGTSVYILGNENTDKNLSVVMAENAAILLEDDYKTKYQGFDNSPEQYIFMEICQSKMVGKSIELAEKVQSQLVKHAGLRDNKVRQTQAIWLVLHSTMPLIFLEVDFICNPEREKYMASETGQRKIAEAVVNGIAAYRNTKITLPKPTTPDAPQSPEVREPEKAQPTPSPTQTSSDPTYHIQIFVAADQLQANSPKFKGLTPAHYYRDGSAYKYYYGSYPTQDAARKALPEVKRLFPDAFVITMQEGKRIK
ncbi:MAG: N-acetylmuramoyl-L-alanine amidase [Paramuribaculum sp.]|nr:N-acetylmuramoyl-L-alanine amidase [Paramuribaculum sp.]